MTQDDILKQIVDRLLANFEVRRVVLFGSRARGGARPDSDYDILAEVESDLPFWERHCRALRPFRGRKYGLDLLVLTPAEVQDQSSIPGSAVDWALAEGRQLYAK
ncbi:MAG: nucleotidyltransferase domain-containing protein [Fimbriimonadaceae bacterium]|nr:nucleotidyltransferase domain-containing protein [Fimbriimonadaceae bacterium]